MKIKLSVLALLGLVLSTSLSLAACGGLTEKTISGTDGVSVSASSAWQQIVGEDELKQLYDSTEVDVKDIKLALGKDMGRDGYLIVEEVYPQQTLAALKNYYMSFANQPDQLEQAVAEMKSYYLTDREIAQITPIIQGETLSPEKQQYLEQEMVLQGYLYNLTKDEALNFSLEQITDMSVNSQKVQFAEYLYTNAQLTVIRQIDGYVQVGERFFLVTLWENEEKYAKNAEEYNKVIESIRIEPEVTTLETTKAP